MSAKRLTATTRLRTLSAAVAATAISSCIIASAASAQGHQPFLNRFNTVTSLTTTVPGNGDVNPYGIVFAPRSIGRLTRGDILVSNFNNFNNLQGTGTTIDEITPGGTLTLFAS